METPLTLTGIHKGVNRMEDRLTRGYVAGVIGGIITNAFSFLAGFLGWTTVRTADLISLTLYAHTPPFTFGELAFALIGHIHISGALGMGFTYLVPRIASSKLWLKGIVFSIAIWYSIYSITTLFELPGTVPTPLNTAITDGIAAVIFGLSLAIVLQAFTPKGKMTSGMSMAPAMKPLDQPGDDNGD